MQDLNDMYYFAKVIEHGGFMAAGRVLGIPKSRLSRRIKLLEERLNTQLLHRTTRKLALTDVGDAFLRHCETVLSAANAATEEIACANALPRGHIKVSAPPAIAQHILARLLPVFMQQCPEVRFSLAVSSRRVDLIEEGIDVALRVRSGAMENSSLIVRTLGRDRMQLVASPAFIQAHGQPESPLTLAQYPTLSMYQPGGQRTWCLVSEEGQKIEVVTQPRLLTDDQVVLREAAIAGQGITALPNMVMQDALRNGTLVPILKDWYLPEGAFQVVYPSRRGLLPAVRAFIDFLAEQNIKE
jgi:DNA-binding transcriptional LysR family regulator